MSKYKQYLKLIQEGNSRAVAERLSCIPNSQFNEMYEDITGKKIADPDKRLRNITEIIDTMKAVV